MKINNATITRKFGYGFSLTGGVESPDVTGTIKQVLEYAEEQAAMYGSNTISWGQWFYDGKPIERSTHDMDDLIMYIYSAPRERKEHWRSGPPSVNLRFA